MKLEAVIFDWDGVIYDTLNVIFNSVNSYLRSFNLNFNTCFKRRTGVELSLNNFKDYISGLSSYAEFYSSLHPAGLWDYELASKIFSNEIINSKLIKGMDGLLKELKKHYKIGLVTLNFKQLIEEKIDFNFDCAVYSDDVENHKPHPEGLLLCLSRMSVPPSNAVFIGDSPTDGQAAVRAGTSFIGVNWGLGTEKSLSKYGQVVDSVENLKKRLLYIK